MGLFNDKDIELLKSAGVQAENREYTIDEKKHMCIQITEFIMNHSSKNGDIGRLQSDYSSVLDKITVR